MLMDINMWTPLWFVSVGVIAIKTTVIVAIAMLLVQWLPRVSSSARFLILFYALVATLLLPVLSSALPQWKILPGWFSVTSTQHQIIPQEQRVAQPASKTLIAGDETPRAQALPKPGSAWPEFDNCSLEYLVIRIVVFVRPNNSSRR